MHRARNNNHKVLNFKVYHYLSIAAAPVSAATSPVSHGTMVVLLDLDDDGLPINEAMDRGAAVITSETQKNDNGFAAALACYPYFLPSYQTFLSMLRADILPSL